MMYIKLLCYAFIVSVLSPLAKADTPQIVNAEAQRNSPGIYTFIVTVKHADTGWEHYADAWEVLDLKGEILATRTLHHPHVNEQPFTRSLSGVSIPTAIRSVQIRAHDKVDGWSEPLIIKLP